MYDIVIKNGKVVTHTDVFEADVAIEGEKIAAIGANLGSAKKEIDAKGNYVMPGVIDPHTHIGIFVKPYSKDLESETYAALFGGTTTILHCLIGNDPMLKQYEDSKAPIKTHAYCDVGFYAALLTDDDLQSIEKLSELGVNSYKFLLAYKGKAAESIGLKGVNIDNGYLYRGFEIIKKTGGLPMIHAENVETAFAIEYKFKDQDTLKTYCDARPNILEEMDLYTSCRIAEEIGVPLYQVHSSVGSAPDIVREFRQRGNKVFLETCPTYFILDYYGENLKEPKFGKINPPIRSPQDKERVLKNLIAGEYDCLGTDTANNTREQKTGKTGNIWDIMLDWSDIELMLPLVLSECVNKGHLTLPEVARITSYNTARIHGLYPKKGVMAVGSDADLLIIDLNKKKVLKAADKSVWHSKVADYCLYEGWEVTGWPVMTMIRGKVVVENDQCLIEPGYGEYVACQPAYRK